MRQKRGDSTQIKAKRNPFQRFQHSATHRGRMAGIQSPPPDRRRCLWNHVPRKFSISGNYCTIICQFNPVMTITNLNIDNAFAFSFLGYISGNLQ
jgi:hypothetical protein